MNIGLSSIQEKKLNSNDDYLMNIQKLDDELAGYFSTALAVDENLTRQLVSFQANKQRAHYRWYKYKEAFSHSLIEYLITKYKINKGKVLDPFAGAGTTLFTCSEFGYDADGIELLPVGQKIIDANILVRSGYKKKIIDRLTYWNSEKIWNKEGDTKDFEVLRITQGAYPKDTELKIKRYLYDIEQENAEVREILLFALLCVLESISFTRKDGQYLRWDYRSGRRNGKNTFDKGSIFSFDEAITKKFGEILFDISSMNPNSDLFSLIESNSGPGTVKIIKDSCLEVLPSIRARKYSGIITSPPYCNRYDYTRTYALEHAILGITESELLSLRQAMLSCTVENKEKELGALNANWTRALDICDHQKLLQEILNYLDYKKERKELNNSGIARMVRGYFYEMACVLQECHRILKKHGYMFMVNDNVRYAGASISVDLILSKIAEDLGFNIKHILVLAQGKGNSSQQMGKHGRENLRKCVYVWQKEE